MSNSFYIYQNTENGQNKSYIPLRNDLSNKCLIKKNKNKIKHQNKVDNNFQILYNSENISNNNVSKYIHCKRHPQNIISFFCETDKTFPCTLCISEHEDHSYKNCYCTKKYFDKEILKIKKLLEDIETRYFQNKKNAENFFSKIKIHFDKEIHKINDYFDSMISILQDKKSEFIAKMLIIYENYIKKFIKYKFIFDICDKSYYSLYQKKIYIENEIYKKEDFESFYKIKNGFINEINSFSKRNDENFNDKNKFYFNYDSMPIFVYPEKQIININDDNNIFGFFKNTNIDFNQKENDVKSLLDKNNVKEKNELIDSININNNLPNNNSLKRKKTNLELFFEKNKNNNIISSINSFISNLNDSFIEKQLLDTNSTLLYLNKKEVKNVFKQQDEEISQSDEKIEAKINNNKKMNKENKISDSPKIEDKYINNKVKYTSCNREKRNKQIIKKFLENQELNKNDISRLKSKLSNRNQEQSINCKPNYLTTFENNYTDNTINNDMQIKEKYFEKKNKNKKKNYPPNNRAKYKQNLSKIDIFLNKKINNYKNDSNVNSINSEINQKKSNNKIKNIFSNIYKIGNVNKYIDDSIDEQNHINNNSKENIYFPIKINNLYKCPENKRKNLSFVKNHISLKNINNLRKNKLNCEVNGIINNKKDLRTYIYRINDNCQKRNSSYNFRINKSNSYKYFNRETFS